MASDTSGIDLCLYPAGTPPAGVTPNLIDPESLSSATLAVCIILTTWAVLTVAARLLVNWGKLNVADYFMGVAALLTISYSGLIISLHKYNRHQWDVPACWMTAHYLQIIFSHVTIVGLVLMFPKWAILFMYRQLFSIHRGIKVSVWIGVAFCFAIYFPSIPLSAIYEAPRAGQSWNYFLGHYPVANKNAMEIWGIIQGSCSVILDIYIFLTPLPVLSKLQMARRKKIQLVALFATAFFGVAASAIALYFRVLSYKTTDSTWHQAQLALCVVTENNTAIIVGCMPAFARFVKLVSTEISSRWSRSKLAASKGSSSETWEPPISLPHTIGSSDRKAKKPRQYYELTDTALLETQVSAVGDGHRQPQLDADGIVRTTDVHQEELRLTARGTSVEQFA